MASAAKQAVSSFLGKAGHHKTTVDESVAPAVTNETIKPHRHENITTAVDREVHQDHHHTTVQPISHRETLAEEHSHNALPVEHKSFEHDDEHAVRARLEQERAKFKNTNTTHDTRHTSSAAPNVEAERVHHHIHEHVQPVIHKETIAPKVVHTTVPIHETHHAASQIHGTSTLPMKSLDEFRTEGGIIDGKTSAHHGEYDGCPRPYNKDLQTQQLDGDRDMHTGLKHDHSHHDHSHHDHSHTGTTGGLTGTNNHSGGLTGTNNQTGGLTGTKNHTGGLTGNGSDVARTGGLTGTNNHTGLSGHGSNTSNVSASANAGSSTKPSLLSKLNPLKDSDHDGKKGFMD